MECGDIHTGITQQTPHVTDQAWLVFVVEIQHVWGNFCFHAHIIDLNHTGFVIAEKSSRNDALATIRLHSQAHQGRIIRGPFDRGLGNRNPAVLGDDRCVDHIYRIHQRRQQTFKHNRGQGFGVQGSGMSGIFDGHSLQTGFRDLSGKLADLFRQLPEIRDWYEANHPRLSKYTMEQAARAAEDWHHGLHGGVVLPRGSVRRGELVLVHPDSDVNDPDGFWTIQRLTSRHQYQDEGRALRHCVGGGGYWAQHERGDTEVYSVRDEHGDPVLTIEVTVQHDDGVVIPKSIEQIKGKNNEVPLRIIAREQTSSGHDVSMALSGAQALIDHLRAIAEEHDETLELCSDVAGMRLHDPDDSFMDDIASGDVLMDQAMASAIAELVHDNYNQNLVRAWAQATEDGHSEYLAPVIAWEQMGIVEEMRPPSMVNLEDWVHERHGRYLERSGDGDEISPWVMLFEEDLVSPSDPTAKITIRGVCWIGFSGESDWDVSSDWYLLTHSELRYEDADGSFETPGFEDFEERHSPERALEHSTHTGKNLDGTEKKYTYTSWDELDLLSSFTHVSHPSIWKVASGDPGPQLRPIIERMDDWIRDGALYEALDELNIAQERAVVTGPFRDELSRLWKLAADDRLLANGKTAIARANARAEEKAAAKAAKDGET